MTESESIPYTQVFVIDAAYQRSLSRALFAASFRSPAAWIILVAFLLIFAAISVSQAQPTLIVLWVVLMVILYGFRYFRLRRTIGAAFPVGRQLSTGFGTHRLATSDGQNSSVLSYSSFDQIEVGRDVVWLRFVSPRRRLAYPRALFPDGEIDKIRAAVSSAGSPQPRTGIQE